MVGFCSCGNGTQKSWEWELNHKAQFSVSTTHLWMKLPIPEAEMLAWLSLSWQTEEFCKDVDQLTVLAQEHLEIAQRALEPAE